MNWIIINDFDFCFCIMRTQRLLHCDWFLISLLCIFFSLSFRSRDVAINLVWLIYTKNTWRILCVTNYVVTLRFTLYTWKIYVPNIRENIKYYAMVIELKHRPTQRFARSRFIEMKSKIIYYIEMQNSKTARR